MGQPVSLPVDERKGSRALLGGSDPANPAL
jgi:hypothetical protein